MVNKMVAKMPVYVFLNALVIILLGYGSCFAAKPALFFSDMTDGPISGWEGSSTKGAAVSIWGMNFGPAVSSSKVWCGGQQISATSSGVAEWGSQTNPTTARKLERITFFLNSSMSVGSTTIKVETDEGVSREIPFYCRELGSNKIMFFAKAANGGSDSNNGLYATDSGSNGPKATLGLIKRDLKAGDVCYIRGGTYTEGDTIDQYSTKSIWDFWNNNHYDGSANKSITVKGYPGELVTLGGATRSHVVYIHGSGPGRLHYWTFSNMKWETASGVTSTGYSQAIQTSHLRFVGLDMTTLAGGKTIMPLTSGKLQEYVYIYGNYFHDAGVNNRSDPAPSTKGYGFSLSGAGPSGGGLHNHIYIGWNESCYHQYGHAFYIYGHNNGDSIDNLYIHDNYFHHNGMRGAILGGGDNGGGGSNYGFVENCWFYNNVLAYNGSTGLLIGDAVVKTAGGGGNFVVEHNTFYKNGGGAFDIEPATDSLVLRRNIVYDDDKYFLRDHAPNNSTGYCNLYYGNSGTIPSWDNNPITGRDPKFVNAGAGNFHIAADSPARTATCE